MIIPNILIAYYSLRNFTGALPLSGHNSITNGNNDTYIAELGYASGDGAKFKNGSYVSEKLAWDADKIFGCLCTCYILPIT